MDNMFGFILEKEAPLPTLLPLYGGATTPLEAMTDEDFNQASEQVYAKVREQAFSRGLPVIVKRNGQLVKEFADGHLELLT